MQGPREFQASTESGTPDLYISEGLRAELEAWVLAEPSPSGLSNHTREGTHLHKQTLLLSPGEEMLNSHKRASRSGPARLCLLCLW